MERRRHRRLLTRQRSSVKTLVERVASTMLPTEYGEFRLHAFQSRINNDTHIALVCGEVGSGEDVLVRMHSQCITGDVLRSTRCDCGAQLDEALRRIALEGRGVLLYLRQEGRGIGLANKIRAYSLQDNGLDTVEANQHLGFNADQRDYGFGAQILRQLSVRSVRLLSNNPKKLAAIEEHGLTVSELVPIEVPASASNLHYLKTKRDKLGHILRGL
jgi:3,4-dihydroxy 2-butanone 4-phosphate synthase / GTP cyclohydrolase II